MTKVPLLFALLLLAGCSKGSGALPQPPGPVQGADYFPLAAGTALSFQGGTGVGDGPIESGRQDWDVASVAGPDGQPAFTIDRRGRGLLNAMTMTVGVRPDGLVSWSGLFGLSKTEFTPPFVELPATITPGMKWTWRGTSKEVPLEIESALEGIETVTVPAGTFACLRIRRRGGPFSVTHWYAKGEGPIRVEMKNPGGRVQLERTR
jgi:hypothetical protein